MKELLTLMFAGFIVLTAAAEVVVYENDFENYQLGEVRRPVQDAAPFMEAGVTNFIYCEVEDGCGMSSSRGLHNYLLEANGAGATGGAQFDVGLDPGIFSMRFIVVYEAAWKGSNLASLDLTDGTNLFFRLYGNGGIARRVGVTNLTSGAFVELVGGQDDPDRVLLSGKYGVYRIHVLFPEGRITLIERNFEGTTTQHYQTGLFGKPGVLPTHFGGGIRAHGFSVKDRNCYLDDLKVSTIPEPAFLAVMALAALFFVGRRNV